MISFSKLTKAQWDALVLDAAKDTPVSGFVSERIYFVEGVGTFIGVLNDTTSKVEAKSYDYNFSTEFAAKADRDNTENAGQVAKIDSDGDSVGTGYTIGDTSKTNFGSSSEIAVESAVTGYVADEISKVNAGTQVAISGISNAQFVDNVGTFTFTRVNGQPGTFTETIDGLASSLTLTNNELDLGIKGGTKLSADIDGLVSGITYTGGTLSIGIKGKAAKTVNLPVEKFLHSAKQITLTSADIQSGNTTLFSGDTKIEASVFTGQTAGTQGIVFQLEVDDDDDATNNTYEYVFIPFSEIITDYTGTAPIVVSGKTISLSYNTSEFTVTDGKLTLNTVPSGKVNAPWNTFAHVVSPADAGQVFVDNGSGDLSGSGFDIGVTSATGFGAANKLATEQAVADLLSFK